ncbi:trypsin-like peptidase domain-containing protein [Microbacterium sp. bgisy203]|uniref:S1C family serine protease n=1 Tax=Microbacterium sp. bgisy203 TaxID=3413799 RepID=UPI003D72B965
MSENAPSANDPQQPDAANAQRPPLPAQPAADAAANPQTSPGAYPTSAAPVNPYAAQAPYSPPRVPTYAEATAAYGASAYATAPQSTAPQSTAPDGAAPSAPADESATPEHEASTGKVGAGKIVGIMVAAALVGGAAGIGGAAAGASLFPQSQTVVTTSPQTVTVNNTESVNQTTAIADKVVPSVVTISASAGSSGGTGSGVILTEDGYVVTNTHVVTLDGETGDAQLSVTTSDGKVYAATIVGTDPTYDLAVIKLTDASGLTPIDFADSTKLNVGDPTVAVGAPLGLSNTVTTGIVSALNRSIQIASSAAPEGGDTQEDTPGQGESPFQFDFGQGQQQSATSSISIAVIQTDAAINPGNSGGALVDGEGKLIGVNVAIASTGSTNASSQAGSIGVGFSIPSNIVKRITDELIQNGEATHGLLGAGVRDAASQQGATVAGAYIAEVTGGGAASAAGLKKGDVVTSFNGFPITDATDLTAQVRALAGGSSAPLVYQRDGKSVSVDVTLGTLDD